MLCWPLVPKGLLVWGDLLLFWEYDINLPNDFMIEAGHYISPCWIDSVFQYGKITSSDNSM